MATEDDIAKDIKRHEGNLKFLKSQFDHLDKSILDLQGDLKKDASKETEQQIMKLKQTAASLFYQVKTLLPDKISTMPVTKDVLGVVATLASVDNDNLSRNLSEYLGLEKMLAIVCRTPEGVNALERYDKGKIDRTTGLHGLGSSIQKKISGRFLVIYLEYLRPYVGGFIDGDQQKKLALPKPKLPQGSSPAGFLDFAVNMVNIDTWNLSYVTANGHGLRETLFYALFSDLQVYRTRTDMLRALPCITKGALSLDGGDDKGKQGLCSWNDVEVKFPVVTNMCNVADDYSRIEDEIRKLKWEQLKVAEDMQREQSLYEGFKSVKICFNNFNSVNCTE